MTLRLISRNAVFSNVASYGLLNELFFADNPDALIFNFRDKNSLKQNSAGSTPVTALNDPVARALDRGGNAYDLVHSGADGQRPLWAQDSAGNNGLYWDGSSSLELTTASTALNITASRDGSTFVVAFTAVDTEDYGILALKNDNSGGDQMRIGANEVRARRTFGEPYTEVAISAGATPTVLGVRADWTRQHTH